MNDLILYVPMETYLKKFLLYNENMTEDTAYNLFGYSPISICLKDLLTNKKACRDDKRYKLKQKYPAKIKVKIPKGKQTRNDIYLNDHRIVKFNIFVRAMFYDLLLNEIRIRTSAGQTEKSAILLFIAELEIWDDIEFDTVLKAVHRLRIRKNNEKLNSQRKSSLTVKKMLNNSGFMSDSVRQNHRARAR